MSEIEKMYENAIGKVCTHTIINPERCNKRRMTRCCGCDYYAYPPFTAEKQIELIKWLVKINYSDERIINYIDGKYYCLYSWDEFEESKLFKTYEEALACAINYIWQDLTEEERKQIADILKG